MTDITKAYPNPVNIEALMETVRNSYPQASTGQGEFRVHAIADENVASVSAALDVMIQQHNATSLTPEQAKAVARTLMLSDAKNYLSTQLASANPNVATIFTTIKAYVDSNAILSQMVTNQIALMQASHGWIINLLTPTSTDRARYIVACQMILATIA